MFLVKYLWRHLADGHLCKSLFGYHLIRHFAGQVRFASICGQVSEVGGKHGCHFVHIELISFWLCVVWLMGTLSVLSGSCWLLLDPVID